MNEGVSLRQVEVFHRLVRVLKHQWRAVVAVLVVLVIICGVLIVPRAVESFQNVDSDGDGLTDKTEEAGWFGVNGQRFFTDLTNGDTDGDGLIDGEESGERLPDRGIDAAFSGISDPLNPDSDGDGLSDGVEVRGWTNEQERRFASNPMSSDTDGDGLDDSGEAGERVQEGVFAAVADPSKRDSDDDGLDDLVEVSGWKSVRENKVFHTDPLSQDTDGDGLSDDEEAAGPVVEEVGPRIGAVVYQGFSDPTKADSDGDGLSDAEEFNYGAKPRVADSDGDGIEDGREVNIIGTSPVAGDTDGDGLDDRFEEENRESGGFDPVFFERSISALDYAKDFMSGAEGEERKDSLASAMGELFEMSKDSLSAYEKVRMMASKVADLFNWGQGLRILSIFATLPPLAFALKVAKAAFNVNKYVSKLDEFIEQHPELRAVAARFISTASIIPDDYRATASSKVWRSWNEYLDEGADEQGLLRLQTSARIDLDVLAGAMENDNHKSGRAASFLADEAHGKQQLSADLKESRADSWWKSVQRFFGSIFDTTWGQLKDEDLEKAGEGIETSVRINASSCGDECKNHRRVADALSDGVIHEANVGYVGLDDVVKARIDADAALIGEGSVEGSQWHFYPSAHSGQLGGTPEMLEYLAERGIAYTIHVPSG